MKKTGRKYIIRKNKTRRYVPKTRKHKKNKVKRTLKGGNPLLYILGSSLFIVPAVAGLMVAGYRQYKKNQRQTRTDMGTESGAIDLRTIAGLRADEGYF